MKKIKDNVWFKKTRRTQPDKISISIGNPNKIDLNKCWGIAFTNEGNFYRKDENDIWNEFLSEEELEWSLDND